MQSKMNVAALRLAVLLLAGTLPAAGTAAQPPGAMADAPAAVLAPQEVEFVQLAQRLHASQQAAARLALAHSRDLRVRQLARKMLSDHAAARARLDRIAASRGLALPAAASDHGARTKELEQLRGVAFDRRFVAAVGIDAHRDAVRIFGLQERWGQDPVLVRFASSQLPVLGRLLARAEALSTQFDLRRRNFPDARHDMDAMAPPEPGDASARWSAKDAAAA